MARRIIVTLTFMLLTAVGAGAQGDWATATHNGEYAFARGLTDRAEMEFKKALEIAQGFAPGDRRLETSLENLGRFYEHQSDFDRAQPNYQLLLATQEHRLGREDPALLTTLFALARVCQPTGDLPTVEASLTRYDEIATVSGGADPRQWWQALAMLAKMEIIQENEPAAVEWQRRAVDVLADDPSATEEERAIQLESLAQMELTAGEGARAEQLYVRIAKLRSEEDEADALSRTMAAGAQAAFGAGEFDTAERLAMRSLNSHPDNKSELAARKVLAEVSWAQVNRGTDDLEMLLAAAEDSEELHQARDRLRQQNTVESDPLVISRLVQVEALRGYPDEAARWQQMLIEKTEGDTTKLRYDLVTLLAAAGKTDEALTVNDQLIADFEAAYGPNDSRLVPVLGQRLNILIEAGRKKEARKINKRLKRLTK